MFNINSGYGLLEGLRSTLQLPVLGKVFVVAVAGDPVYEKLQQIFVNDPAGDVRVYGTLKGAYDACVSNRNDVILLDGASSFSQAMLTVSKNRVHFFGMGGGARRNSQSTKIVTTATDVAASIATIRNTGVRNTYHNIKFIQQGLNAAQVNSFIDEGEGTYVENCHFSHISLLTTVGVSPLLFAGDTCHYKNCQIGDSTIYRTAQTQYQLKLGVSNGAYARYSFFDNCTVVSYSSQTNSGPVGTTGATHLIGWVEFRDCSFIGAHLADGVTAGGSPAAAVVSALSTGYIYLGGCHSYGCTLIASTHASVVNSGPASAATAGGGLGVAGA